jgi:hypothetical protein
MTSKKTLKDRVRERQEKTGERYTTALAHVKARVADERHEEAHDVTREAELEGFACDAFATEALWQAECSRGAPEVRFRHLLRALRAMLHSSAAHGPITALLPGSPSLRGEVPNAVRELAEARQFLSAVRSGVRGLSPNGRLVALTSDGGEVVLGVALALPFPVPGRRPVLQLSTLAEGPAAAPWEAAFSTSAVLAGLGG